MNEMPKVGPYSLVRKIAVSDIAVSYAVEIPTDSRTSRVVSLKILSPDCSADPGFSAQIKKDAALVHEINHINIGQTWDLAQRDGVYYLCLEYIEGASLRHLLELTGPAPAPVAAFITSEIAAALSYAHARTAKDVAPNGIIHGDLRPRKVLISRTGAVKLVDFAVSRARALADEDPVHISKRESEIIAYTSPSVARGGVPTVASDIFSAAAIAYRLLLGRRLYNGTDYQEVHAQAIEGTFPSIMDLAPDCPSELADIIMRGLGASDKPVYTSAQAFRSALSAWIRRNAVGFGRHKVKEHFGEPLTDNSTGRGVRPLSRREFSALDSASLIHDNAPASDSSPSVSLIEIYAARDEVLDTEEAVQEAFGAGGEAPNEADEIEQIDAFIKKEAKNVESSDSITGQREAVPSREATQAMIPDSDLGELDIDYGLDEDDESEIPTADADRTYRDTLGKSAKLKSSDGKIGDAKSTEDEVGAKDKSTGALDALTKKSTGGPAHAALAAGSRSSTRQFSPERDVYEEASEAGSSKVTPPQGDKRLATQQIEATLRNETEAMGTLHQIFEEEEPPRSGGAANDLDSPSREIVTEPAEPIYPDDTTPNAASAASSPVGGAGAKDEFYGIHEEETEVPRAALERPAPHSDGAAYNPGRPSDDFLQYDDTEIRKTGRGSLGYLIILLAFVGLGVGAWYLYQEVQAIQQDNGISESQGIFVTSRPQGAMILLDDQPTGETAPALIDVESIGTSHRVSVEMPGYEAPPSKQVMTSVERRGEADFELTPLPHLIHVESEPQGARVYLDGELAGTTPVDIGPVRQDPRQGINLLLMHDELGRKTVSHEWDPGSERSSVSVNMNTGTTVR